MEVGQNEDDTLSVVGTYTDDTEESDAHATFTNTYSKPIELALKAEKKIEGTPKDNETFTFKLTEINNDGVNTEKELQTKTRDGVGEVDFDAIKYTRAGTYTYTIAEVSGNNSNYEYDTAEWTVTVNVTRDDNGTLSASATYTRAGETSTEKATFTNKYFSDAKFTPKAEKEIDGTPDSENLDFKFELKDKDGNLIDDQQYTVLAR